MIEVQDIITGKIVKIPTREERIAVFLKKLDREQEKRDMLEPKIKPRAIFFERAINWMLICLCIAAALFMIELVLSEAMNINRILGVFIPAAIIMVVSLIALNILLAARYLWERKLNKVGLYTPLEFEQKNTPD